MLSAPSSCLSWPFSAQTGTLSSLGFSLCWQCLLRVTKKPQQSLPEKFQKISFLSLVSQFNSTAEKKCRILQQSWLFTLHLLVITVQFAFLHSLLLSEGDNKGDLLSFAL